MLPAILMINPTTMPKKVVQPTSWICAPSRFRWDNLLFECLVFSAVAPSRKVSYGKQMQNSYHCKFQTFSVLFSASRHPEEGPGDESEAGGVRRWAMLTSNDNFFSFKFLFFFQL
jgi:hypothetical protein